MTPGARVAAAIGVLDLTLAGMAAEQALTNWARGSRYAGSGDRAAVRDLVFGALRCRRSYAALGGSETGRGLMIGAMHAAGDPPAAWFTGQGHGAAVLTDAEQRPGAVSGLAELDCPDWLGPELQASLGADFGPVMRALQGRAPVFLRVNLRRATPAQAQAALAQDGITARPHALAKTALEVTGNARKIQTSRAYLDGLVELQDAASQAILHGLAAPGMRVLDYCAGGGGKALALAAMGAQVWAHDADPRRMRDLPARAARAGVTIPLLERVTGVFDLVVLDVPCSGSGSWRRSPEGKWALCAERLAELLRIQAEILDIAMGYAGKAGKVLYSTCALLDRENAGQIRAFVQRHPAWRVQWQRRLTPLDGGDGFYAALLTRE